MQRYPFVPACLLVVFSWYLSAGDVQETRKAERRGRQLFFRLLGACTNAPLLPKTRSAWSHDNAVRTGTTGMADEGFTEFPFCFGRMDFTFLENYAIYPRIVSGVQADPGGVNTADILIDHVYQPDGCVWGYSGREFVQTFAATSSELVSITLLIASRAQTFKAALVKGGPGGEQIGPEKSFSSGHSMSWGTVRWKAGQAPLEPEQVYGIRIWSPAGEAFTPYLHATGNAYDGGRLYVDGEAKPATDLAVWIVQEPPELKRALVSGADADGWCRSVDEVAFRPRSATIRLVTATLQPVSGRTCDLVLEIRSEDGRLIAEPKRSLASGPAGGARTAPFLFASDALSVDRNRRYTATVYPVPHKGELPERSSVVMKKRDIQLRAYGEPKPGAQSSIFNLKVAYQTDSRLEFSWIEPFPCPTEIEISGPGPNGGKTFFVDAGITKAVVPLLWSGHKYQFRLTSTAPGGLAWQTPLYCMRMPRPDVEPINQTPPYPKSFVTLAPPVFSRAPSYGPLRYIKEVPLVNSGFEKKLDGWKVEPAGVVSAPDLSWTSKAPAKKQGISTKWGDGAAGFTHCAGEKREQVFQESTLMQEIATEPGHWYLLSAMLFTTVTNGPRGDTRIRLFASPEGGDPEAHATQWYWTDGEWMRFQHRWKAEGKQSGVGFQFFRWRDLDHASAYVDQVCVYDLGKAPLEEMEASAETDVSGNPLPALTDLKVESDARVEGYAEAPPGYVITGIGSRAHYDNITTMWLKVQPLLPDGTLGLAEQIRTGWDPDSHLEAKVELPDGYIATGFGAGVAPEWDVKRLRVWARPLLADGSLGDEKEFRGGVDLESGVEKQVRCGPGRVLISAGLNCMLNDINKIKASSARLVKQVQ